MQGSQFLKSAIHITPARASQSAIRAVEKKGGSVYCKYYNDLALRDCVKGRTDRIEAAPTRKTDIRTWHTPVETSHSHFCPSVVHVLEEPGVSLINGSFEDASCDRPRQVEGFVGAAPCVQDAGIRQGQVVVFYSSPFIILFSSSKIDFGPVIAG